MASFVNLTNFCSQSNEEIKFIFVREPESNLLSDVIKELKEFHPDIEMIEEIDPDECFEITEDRLTSRKYIFIFNKFDTPAFKHISELAEIYILGPKCVLTCINEQLEVPASSLHIHNLCMKDLFICSSSIGNPERKSEIKSKISYMGGVYNNSLTDDITHLITEDIFSKKYVHAGAHNIVILHPSWIDDMWSMSQDIKFDKRADDKFFLEKYQLKIFHKLVFSSTGLESDEKKKLMKLIEENGGVYSHTFKTATVKVLIMKQKDIGCLKHKASLKHDIFCVDPSWIFDSITSRYALSIDSYLIKNEGKLKSSTPTKNTSALGRFNFDNTMLSEISDTTTRNVVIDETQKSNLTRASTNFQALLQKPESSTNHKPNLRQTKSSNMSLKTKDSTFKKPVMPLKSERKTENFLIPSPPKFEYSEEASDESFIQILIDKTVCIYGYTNDIDSMQVLKECEKLGAKLVDLSYSKTVDYVITSAEILEIELPKLKYKNIVTDVWLEESVELGRCIEPLEFYHHSIFKPLEKYQVLKDEIFVCSNYDVKRQRPFIRLLVRALGGNCKEALSRSEGPILICPAPEGKKFEGARNWNLTVLKAEWLLACYKEKTRVNESDYLVGDTNVSSKNIKKRESVIPCSQEYVDSDDVPCGIDSPVRKTIDKGLPETPKNSSLIENDKRIGNISYLLEDMPTPQRNTTKAVLLEQQKKTKVSPRTKLLKELMQTPGNNAQKSEYMPSPAPELPQCLMPPKENYGLIPDSSPASQWYYKRKLDALDDRHVANSDKSRKALIEVSVTPPYSHARHDFFKKRLTNFASPDPRLKNTATETLNFFMARVTANMSNEASKFLNFEDTENDGGPLQNAVEDSDILKLDEMARRKNSYENKITRKSANQHYEDDTENNKKLIDFDPAEDIELVRWSNSQRMPKNTSFNDEETNVNANDKEGNENYIFAISSGHNAEEKEILGEKILQLGGQLTDVNFSHLIMTKITKSSKFFTALAGGKFVLHSDYIEECILQNRFVDPEPFEFGNPNFKVASKESKDLLFNAPYKCRQLVKNNPEKYKNGMFTGMKFIVLAQEEKLPTFISIIETAGGTVIDEKPEFSTSVLKRCKVDYCLTGNQKALTRRDVETLKSCNVQVKNIKFIHEYLLRNE